MYDARGPNQPLLPLEDACNETVQQLLGIVTRVAQLGPGKLVADLGAAFGGTARLFARRWVVVHVFCCCTIARRLCKGLIHLHGLESIIGRLSLCLPLLLHQDWLPGSLCGDQ
jgi:hypothetical protein